MDAPPADVFAFLDDPDNRLKVVPSLVDVSDVSRLPNGGTRAEYTYMLAGVKLGGTVRDIRREAPNRLVQSLSGTIDGTIRHTFEVVDSVTEVTYETEFDLPRTVLESVAEPILQTHIEQDVETTLANLKAHFEA